MASRKVVIVYYRLWPGTGIKGVASSEDSARQMVRILMKNRRQASRDVPYQEDGFQFLAVDVDAVEVGDRKWLVDANGAVEVKDEAAPEVPPVPGGG